MTKGGAVRNESYESTIQPGAPRRAIYPSDFGLLFTALAPAGVPGAQRNQWDNPTQLEGNKFWSGRASEREREAGVGGLVK